MVEELVGTQRNPSPTDRPLGDEVEHAPHRRRGAGGPVRVLVAEPGRHERVHRARRQGRGRGGRGRRRRRSGASVSEPRSVPVSASRTRSRSVAPPAGRCVSASEPRSVRASEIRRRRGGRIGRRSRAGCGRRASGRIRRRRRIGRGCEAREGDHRQPRPEQRGQHQSPEDGGSQGRRRRGITHGHHYSSPASTGEASHERTNCGARGHARRTVDGRPRSRYRATLWIASCPRQPPPMTSDCWPPCARTGPALLTATALGLLAAGLFAWFLAMTDQLLPHDLAWLTIPEGDCARSRTAGWSTSWATTGRPSAGP